MGLSAFVLFVLVSVIALVHDEVHRHKDLSQTILSKVDLLKSKYNCDDKEVERILQEFEEYDKI